jgi:hypothetical protein
MMARLIFAVQTKGFFRMMRPAIWPIFAALLVAAPPVLAESGPVVALELILAVDASTSVDQHEYGLQIGGLAEAFRHPAVHAAIRQSGDEGIAVAVVAWSGASSQSVLVPWIRVVDAASALRLADLITVPGRAADGNTAIAKALRFMMPLFEANGLNGRRKVIDVSGDGRDNRGPPPITVRPRLLEAGITVNGLAIMSDDVGLHRYYIENVITGSGAFAMAVDGYDDFADAILKKLLREIIGAPVAGLGSSGSGPSDSRARAALR